MTSRVGGIVIIGFKKEIKTNRFQLACAWIKTPNYFINGYFVRLYDRR